MNQKTNLFFNLALFLLLGFQFSSCSLIDKRPSLKGLAILQSMTTGTETQIIVMAKKGETYRYTFTMNKPDGISKPVSPQVVERSHSDWVIHHLNIDGLKVAKDYTLYVRGPDGAIIDRRNFSTLDLNKQAVRFAAASCMDDRYLHEQLPMWKALREHKPHILFMIGDNVYADKGPGKIWGPASPEQMWNRYVETRNSLDIFRHQQLIPTLSIWDDHDYGANNGDRTYEHKDKAKEIFSAFFGSSKESLFLKRGPGVAKWLKAYGQNFIFLDDRSFRSPNNKDSKNETHWGAKQEKWLIDIVTKNPIPTWLINGDQIFGGYHRFESYEGNHPKSFKKILPKLGKLAAPLIFLTGDRHLTEIMRIDKPDLPYTTYEITTSGIHAKMFPGALTGTPNRRQIFAKDGVHNYAIIESRAEKSGKKLSTRVSIYGPDNTKLDERTLTIAK